MDRKLQHFRNLVSLAAADGTIQDIERITLSKIAFEKGIPLDRLNVMLDRANEYAYLVPQNFEEKEEQLEDMINFALVDGEFSKAERELIMSVGERLGFSKEELERMIKAQLE